MITPPWRTIRSAASRTAQKDARQVHVDHGLPLCERQLSGDLAVLHFHQQAVLDDARVVDEHIEAAEILDHAVPALR